MAVKTYFSKLFLPKDPEPKYVKDAEARENITKIQTSLKTPITWGMLKKDLTTSEEETT